MIGAKNSSYLTNPKIPQIAAILGFMLYTAFAAFAGNTSLPNMDEGSFLLKGLTFVNGKYHYLQPYAYWNNKLYLPFYIFGWLQAAFGTGLWIPRVFAFCLSVASLGIVWRVSNNKVPGWPTAFLVWVFALSLGWVNILAKANTQILTHFLLVCILAIYSQRNLPNMRMVAGGVLMGVLLLTRETLLFLAVPWLLFLFWAYGKRQAMVGTISFVIVLMVGNLIYYPEILDLWRRVLPRAKYLEPFVETVAKSGKAEKASLAGRLASLAQGVGVYPVLLFAALKSTSMLLLKLPAKNGWSFEDKLAIFLAAGMLSVFLPHAYAALALSYCVYCFSAYLGFFMVICSFLFIQTWPKLSARPKSAMSNVLSYLSFGVVVFFLVVNHYNLFGRSVASAGVGSLTIGAILANKFYASPTEVDILSTAMMALIAGASLLIMPIAGNKLEWVKKMSQFFLPALLVYQFGVTIASRPTSDCAAESVPLWFNQVGEDLRKQIPVDASVYIDGANASLPLLYLNDRHFFPPQVNNYYSYKDQPDSDSLLRDGFWNATLKEQWRKTASVYIFDKDSLPEYDEEMDLSSFKSTTYIYPQGGCAPKIEYYVFVR